MDLIGRCGADRPANESAIADVELRSVRVGKGQRIVRPVVCAAGKSDHRLRKSADAVVEVVRESGLDQIGVISAGGVDSVDRIRRFAKQRVRIKIGPAFTHSARYVQRQSGAVSVKAVRKSVRVFVDHDLGIEIAVDIGRRAGPEIHLHPAARSVRRRREVRVVRPRTILSLGRDAVKAIAAATEVVLLEVERLLGEAETVKLVVVPIVDVEKLRYRGPLWVVHAVRLDDRRARRDDLAGRRRRIARVGVRVQRAHGKIEGPRRIAGGATVDRIDAVGRVAIEPRLVGVAVGLIAAVRDPAVVVERVRRFVSDPRYQRPGERRALRAVRRRRTGRQRKRVVGDVYHRVRICVNVE